MANINVGDRVQIKTGDKNMVGKFGRLVLLTDNVNCLVMLDDGGHAQVTIDQLKKID